MTDYIEREAVLNILASKNAPWDGYQKVSELPAADVQPVKHGQWLLDNPQYLLSRCSECQCFNSIGYKWKYCPNCGARMNSEE